MTKFLIFTNKNKKQFLEKKKFLTHAIFEKLQNEIKKWRLRYFPEKGNLTLKIRWQKNQNFVFLGEFSTLDIMLTEFFGSSKFSIF